MRGKTQIEQLTWWGVSGCSTPKKRVVSGGIAGQIVKFRKWKGHRGNAASVTIGPLWIGVGFSMSWMRRTCISMRELGRKLARKLNGI